MSVIDMQASKHGNLIKCKQLILNALTIKITTYLQMDTTVHVVTLLTIDFITKLNLVKIESLTR